MAKFLKRYNTQEEYDQDLPNLNKEWMIGYVKEGKKVNYLNNPYYKAVGLKYRFTEEFTGENAFFNLIPETESVLINGVSYDPSEINSRSWSAGEYEVKFYPKSDSETINYLNCDGNERLVEVYIDDNCGITEINAGSFGYCSSLREIVIPNTITSIGSTAFKDCRSLREIVIPSSVTSIGDGAFNGCNSLKKIILKDSDTTLTLGYRGESSGKGLFYDCSLLEEVYLGRNLNYSFSSTKGYSPFYGTSLTKATISPEVTSIGNFLFSHCKNLARVSFSNDSKLVSIGVKAFFNSTSITSFFIPENVTELGEESFRDCRGLVTVTIPETSNLVTIHRGAFYWCENLSSINLPDNLTNIEDNVFYYCPALSSINIPEKLTTLGDYAFYFSGISSINIPKNLINIGDRVINRCSNLTSIVVDGENTVYDSRGNCNAIIETRTNRLIYGCSTTVIPSEITIIGSYAFHHIDSLSSITIPEGIINIEDYAFYECTGLVTVTVPETSRLVSIGISAFEDSHLETIILPETIEEIGKRAFMHCNISSIDIPPKISSIKEYTFSNCTNLHSVNIPETSELTIIERNAFSSCTNLPSIVFPEALELTRIEMYAFDGCSTLSSINFPGSLVYIGSRAFSGCKELSEIISSIQDASAVSVMSSAFSIGGDSSKERILWVPFNSTGYEGGYWTVLYDNGFIKKKLYEPAECTELTITADNVIGNETNTLIHYRATTNGFDNYKNQSVTGVVVTGTAVSEEFPTNTSLGEEVSREISFTFMGITATTTITQGIYILKSYSVILNDNWRLSSTVANPDSLLYDGVYESFSNLGVHSSGATMYIDIEEYSEFTVYIRSQAESNHDYVMISQLDQEINKDTNYSNTSLVKDHTRGQQNSGTDINSYRKVTYTNISPGSHRITIVYRKDSSSSTSPDQGFILIPVNYIPKTCTNLEIISAKNAFWDQTQTEVSYLATTNGLSDGVLVEGKLIEGIGMSNTFPANDGETSVEREISFTYLETTATTTITHYSKDLCIDLSCVDIYGNSISQTTANCYVITKLGFYKFPAVYGNSIKNGETNEGAYKFTLDTDGTQINLLNSLGNPISTPYVAEDTNQAIDRVEVTQADVSFGDYVESLEFSNGEVKLSITGIPDTGGNLLISALTESGSILWTWHIWLWPAESVSLNTQTITNANGVEYELLPVNLASRLDSNGGIVNWYYQHGRPTPNLGASSYSSTSFAENFGTKSREISSYPADTISIALQNPNIFFGSSISPAYNWSYDTVVHYLWDAGNQTIGSNVQPTRKTVYDPSPVGFCVPNSDALTGFTTSNIMGSWTGGSRPYNNNGYSFTFGSSIVFVPAIGWLKNRDGAIGYINTYGGFYSTDTAENNSSFVYQLSISSTPVVNPFSSDCRARGNSVRPMREIN